MNQRIAELEELEKWAKDAVTAAREQNTRQQMRLLEKKRRLKENCHRQAEAEFIIWKDRLLKKETEEEEREKAEILAETKRYLLRFEEEKKVRVAQIVREITGCMDIGEII